MNFPVFPDGITHPDTLQYQAQYYFVFKKSDPVRERATVDFFRFLTSQERARAFARMQDATSAVYGAQLSDFSDALRDIAGLIAKACGDGCSKEF